MSFHQELIAKIAQQLLDTVQSEEPKEEPTKLVVNRKKLLLRKKKVEKRPVKWVPPSPPGPPNLLDTNYEWSEPIDSKSGYQSAPGVMKQADLRKESGSKLRRLAKIIRRLGSERGGGHTFELKLGGKVRGQMIIRTDDAGRSRVLFSSIDPELRGMGLGKKLYGEVMRSLPKGKLHSDSRISPDAYRVWESMSKRKGYSIKERPAHEIRIQDKQRARHDWKGNNPALFTGQISRKARGKGSVVEGPPWSNERQRELLDQGERLYRAVLAGKGPDVLAAIRAGKKPKVASLGIEARAAFAMMAESGSEIVKVAKNPAYTPKERKKSWAAPAIAAAPAVGIKALSDLPKGMIEQAIESKTRWGSWKPPAPGTLPTQDVPKKWWSRGAGRSVGTMGVGLATTPVFLSGIKDLQSSEKSDRRRGLAKVLGSGVAYNLGKGGIESLVSEGRKSVWSGSKARLISNIPSLALLSYGLSKGQKEKSRKKKYLYGALAGAGAGVLKGGIEAFVKEPGLRGKELRRAIVGKGLGRGGGGLIGGIVLTGVLDKFLKKKASLAIPAASALIGGGLAAYKSRQKPAKKLLRDSLIGAGAGAAVGQGGLVLAKHISKGVIDLSGKATAKAMDEVQSRPRSLIRWLLFKKKKASFSKEADLRASFSRLMSFFGRSRGAAVDTLHRATAQGKTSRRNFLKRMATSAMAESKIPKAVSRLSAAAKVPAAAASVVAAAPSATRRQFLKGTALAAAVRAPKSPLKAKSLTGSLLSHGRSAAGTGALRRQWANRTVKPRLLHGAANLKGKQTLRALQDYMIQHPLKFAKEVA